MTYYFKVLRPWQWLKNTLIFIPYILGKENYGADVLEIVYIFLIFSLFVSSTYIFNDIKDKDLDKLHPSKKYRPIAAGKLDTKNAIIFALLIFISTLLSSYLINNITIVYFLIYTSLTLLYSYKAKYIFILDTLFVSLMFTVRILIGGSVAEINPTIYLLSSIFFISCILSTSKKISIINTKGIGKDNIFYQMLKKQNQINRFRNLYILFSIFSTGSLIFWFLDLSENSTSIIRQSLLLLSILGFIILLNYIYKFSISGDLEDFSSEIFKNKILLFLSLIIGISFCTGYFLI
jgi:4-hydroxybenzoate polyprenyltransferase